MSSVNHSYKHIIFIWITFSQIWEIIMILILVLLTQRLQIVKYFYVSLFNIFYMMFGLGMHLIDLFSTKIANIIIYLSLRWSGWCICLIKCLYNIYIYKSFLFLLWNLVMIYMFFDNLEKNEFEKNQMFNKVITSGYDC